MSASPSMAAILPMLMARLASSGGGASGAPSGPGGPGTGPGGNPSDDAASSQFGSDLSSARQADPAALGQTVAQVKQQVLSLINQTGMSNPGVARALSKCLQGLDAAMKEAASAAATLQIAQPINSSAANGAPGAGGPGPGSVGVPGMGQF